MPIRTDKSINISVSPRLYAHIKKIALTHDIVSHTENPKVTSTAREILKLFCSLDRMPGIEKLKEEGLTTKEIVRQGVWRLIDEKQKKR